MNENPGRSSSVIAAPPTKVALLEHQRAQAGLGQVRRVGQAVVAAADHDGVVRRAGAAGWSRSSVVSVMALAVFRAGLKKGSGAVVTATMCVLWCSVVSMCRPVPGAASSGRTRARPMWRWSTGE